MSKTDPTRAERICWITEALIRRYGERGPTTTQLRKELHLNDALTRLWLKDNWLWGVMERGHVPPYPLAVAVADCTDFYERRLKDDTQKDAASAVDNGGHAPGGRARFVTPPDLRGLKVYPYREAAKRECPQGHRITVYEEGYAIMTPDQYLYYRQYQNAVKQGGAK